MVRKLLVVLSLVAALTLGSLATTSHRQVAQAAADSLVLVWNEETLESVRKLPPGPTVTARALAVVHTTIYDAWAAYDPVAVDTRQRLRGTPGLRQPPAERTQANKEKAVSFAAYTALVDLFPARTGVFDQRMTTLGFATDGTDTSTPAMVGTTAAQAVLDFRHAMGPTSSTAMPTPASRRAISRSTPGTRSWTPTAGSRCVCPPHRPAPPPAPGGCSRS